MVFVNHIRNGRKIIQKQRELQIRKLSGKFLPLDLYIKLDIIKKQQKTPVGELEIARKRLKEIKMMEAN